MNARLYSARDSSFTLIEILVVVSILALLIGLLFPAIHHAKEKGRRSTCMNNLRQIIKATHMYCEDYGGYFPPFDSRTATYLFSYLSIKGVPDISNEKHVFYCPNARGKPIIEGCPVVVCSNAVYGGPYTFGGGLQCYGYNVDLQPGYANTNNTWLPPGYPGLRKVFEVSSAERVFWSMDGAAHWINYWGAGNIPRNRHGRNEGFNAAFVDGHVAWIGWKDFDIWQAAFYPPGKPFAWW